MLWDVLYYDDLSRSTKSYTQHYLGGVVNSGNYDLTNTTYNFTNVPTTTTRQHFTNASATTPLVTIASKFLYDHMGRKLKTWQQLTSGSNAPDTSRLISQTDYNEIGQATIKHLHSKDSINFYQNISYAYNERGWLLSNSAPLFAMQLMYNTGTNKQYNGNIMYQYYGTPGALNTSYTYLYDKLNRLISGKSSDSYNEQGISYDLMGNMQTLRRYQAGTLIDSLNYLTVTNSNKLASVTDLSTNDAGLLHGTWTYGYNGNGNQNSNAYSLNSSKNTSTTYNLLNLPLVYTVPGGTVTYTYDANGQKLRKVSVIIGTTNTTDYIGGIQYNNSTTVINQLQTEDGRAVPNGISYDYQYYLGDNLGNTRVTFSTKTGSAVNIQRDDYYPFGMEILRNTPPTPKNEYLYNQKEMQEELNQYDYGARFYDPVIARWNVVDPMAEVSRRWSVYNYVENNPIKLTDPDGMDSEDWGETQALQLAALIDGLSLNGAPGSQDQETSSTPKRTSAEATDDNETDGGPKDNIKVPVNSKTGLITLTLNDFPVTEKALSWWEIYQARVNRGEDPFEGPNGDKIRTQFNDYEQTYAYAHSLYEPAIEGLSINASFSIKGVISSSVTTGIVTDHKQTSLFITPSINFGLNAGGSSFGAGVDYLWGFRNDATAQLKDFGGGSAAIQGNLVLFSGGYSTSVSPVTGKATTGFTTFNYGLGAGVGLNYSKGITKQIIFGGK